MKYATVKNRIKKDMFLGVKQHEKKDCGAACLSTVSKYYGVNIPIAVTRELVKIDSQGTSIFRLINGANKLGLQAEGLEGNFEDFLDAINNKEIELPIIVHTVDSNLSTHFIVLLAFKRKSVVIFDPAIGKKVVNLSEFKRIWSGYIITIKPSRKFFELEGRWKPFEKFKLFFLQQKNKVFLVLIFSLIISLISIATSFSYKIIIDNFILPPSSNSNFSNSKVNYWGLEILTQNYKLLLILIISLYIVQALISFIRGLIIAKISKKISMDFCDYFYNHLISLQESFFKNYDTGDILSRYQSLIYSQNLFFEIFLTLILESIMVFIGGWTLFRLNHTLFLITVVIVLIYAIVTILFINPINKINREIMNNEAESITHVNETLDGIETVKMFTSEHFFKKIFSKKIISLTTNMEKSMLYQNVLITIVFTVENIGIILILMYGSLLVIDGSMSLGTLISFESIVFMFIGPIKNLINIQEKIQTSYITFDRLNDILEISREDEEWEKKSINYEYIVNNEICIEDVSFSYNSEINQLTNINIEIEKNSFIGLVGTNGSGKTTLMKVISTLLKVEVGQVYIGGIDIRNCQLSDLRKQIGYVPQQSFFISGTIKDNLLLGETEFDKNLLEKIYLGLKINEIEEALIKSGNPLICEDGLNLSSGQKQKIGIARAVLKKPKLLLLDEATSNLDPISEKYIYRFLHEIQKDTTIISIIHDMSLSLEFEKIIVLDKGAVVGYGNHQQLSKTCPEYKILTK